MTSLESTRLVPLSATMHLGAKTLSSLSSRTLAILLADRFLSGIASLKLDTSSMIDKYAVQ